MSTIRLKLPDSLHQRLQQVAEESNRSVEAVALDSLAFLFAEPSELPSTKDLDTLPDEHLWALSRHRMNSLEEARLHELTAQGRSGDLTADEKQELEKMLALLDRFILLRSKALALLKQRGHDINSNPHFTD